MVSAKREIAEITTRDKVTSDPVPALIVLEPLQGPPVPVLSYCSIGRDRQNSIVLACADASRRHAIIRREPGGQCIVLDLGSSNGTFVNGKRISHSHALSDGDTIQIGSERFVLRVSSQQPQSTAEPPTATDRGAAFVPCWLLVGDTSINPDTSAQTEDSSFKTMVGWLQACYRVVEGRHGCIPDLYAPRLLAFWPDTTRSPVVAAEVAETLRQLHPLQVRARMEFRLALHFGTVLVGEERQRGARNLVGTELDFARAMETLAWKLSVPCLVSEEAHRLLGDVLPATALPPLDLKGTSGSHRFFSPLSGGD